MTIVGTKVLRKEDPTFLTDGATYTADLDDPRLDGALHATYVRSTVANGRIESIDIDDALTMPGVVAVITAADLPEGLQTLAGAVPLFPPDMLNRPVLCSTHVRFVGEPIAVVLTEEAYQGEDAAETVFVDIEPLPAVVDLEAAARDEVVIHEGVGTNMAFDFSTMGMATGFTDDSFFEGCEVVVSQRVAHQRMSAAPLEVRSAATAWDNDRVVMWMSTQAAHGARDGVAAAYGLEAGQVHLIAPDVGGGFGSKINIYPEEILLPHLAKITRRPVRWLETRTENMLAMGYGRAHVHYATIGGDRSGNVTHYRIDVLADSGAYARIGGFLSMFTLPMVSGVYDIPHIETQAKAYVTNTVPSEAFRGAGRPEATLSIERCIDLFAAEIGLDPVEVRRRNLIQPDAFPVTTAVGTVYDSGDYETSLDKALEAAGIDDLREERDRRRESGDRVAMGIGVCVYVEVTAGPAPGGNEYAKVEITPEGKARVYSGSLSHGQSHATTFAMIASEQLGMPIEDIEVIQGDTDKVAQGSGTFGSRSTQLGGSAVFEASGGVVDKAREIAADLLEAAADDIVLNTESGLFHVAGSPAVSKGWADVAEAAEAGGLVADKDFNANCSYPFGTHIAVVDVDTDTGGVTLRRMITCDDAGTIINPIIVEGQRHGGIAQGVAQALMEEVVYDPDGNPVTSNFADYGIISMAELPSFELVSMETPSPNNPLGAKGVGESGAIGCTPAVQSAVLDALSPFGVSHIDVPITPQKIWMAIGEANG